VFNSGEERDGFMDKMEREMITVDTEVIRL
jgi:hypothetical protein